jgi:uroporphyrinogen decarboxylase
MTSRELVKRAIQFRGVNKIPVDLPKKYGTDFYDINLEPTPDVRPSEGVDEWGAVWANLGICVLGEVKDYPLKSWSDFENLIIPDITDPKRWDHIEAEVKKAEDKFIFGWGISIYERAHFVRGLENLWMDIYENPEQLGKLLDILVEMNLYAIDKYAEHCLDGFEFCDDWGLQNRVMISPETFRKIWKPRYARIYKHAHEKGMLTILHSCGHIVEILDDLIDAGLDVIQMDQQENMGLELLSDKFGGRITFWCPVDIQNTMANGTMDEIRAYCRKMVKTLGTEKGGFMVKWYGDPKSAGHRQEAVDVMSEEFLKINKDFLKGGFNAI